MEVMTREEAKDRIPEQYFNLHKMIDEIFDDFESRTCESCKYYIERKCFIISDYVNTTNLNEYVNEEFGCNKWEKKDEI